MKEDEKSRRVNKYSKLDQHNDKISYFQNSYH